MRIFICRPQDNLSFVEANRADRVYFRKGAATCKSPLHTITGQTGKACFRESGGMPFCPAPK
jgi:hypothetical protein